MKQVQSSTLIKNQTGVSGFSSVHLSMNREKNVNENNLRGK